MSNESKSHGYQLDKEMKKPSNSERRDRRISNLMPVTIVMAASVLIIVLVMGLGWQVWQSYLDHKGSQEQAFPIQTLRDRIIHFDEVLTMSANMAAATGDLQWEKRYRDFEPQLDVAIKSLRELVPETFDSAAAIQTDQANIKLVEMENKVFELVGQGRLNEAQMLISSGDYYKQKKLYSSGMERIATDLGKYVTADLETHRKKALVALLGFLLLALIWMWVPQNMRRYLKERERLLKTLTAKNEELQSIVYVVSHDLKSPLVNIQGFSGELAIACEQVEKVLHGDKMPAEVQHKLDTVLDEDIPQCLNYISSSTTKMQSLLKGLLEVSRVGTATFKKEPINMNEMMRQIVTGMQFQITSGGVDVIVDDLPGCIGDTGHINQVFTNLLNNAIKYLDPNRKGIIHVSGRTQGRDSIYYVKDNGIGIAPAHQPKIFELFHRLDPEGSVKGEGLGLTIARRILDREGGNIWLESQLGKESSFFISLPRQ